MTEFVHREELVNNLECPGALALFESGSFVPEHGRTLAA
jgi:hypothetical protein